MAIHLTKTEFQQRFEDQTKKIAEFGYMTFIMDMSFDINRKKYMDNLVYVLNIYDALKGWDIEDAILIQYLSDEEVLQYMDAIDGVLLQYGIDIPKNSLYGQ